MKNKKYRFFLICIILLLISSFKSPKVYAESEITSIFPFDSGQIYEVSYPVGTRLENINLPSELYATTKEDIVKIENIKWKCDKEYNESVSDTYTFSMEIPPNLEYTGQIPTYKIFLYTSNDAKKYSYKSSNTLLADLTNSFKIHTPSQLVAFSYNYNSGNIHNSLNLSSTAPIHVELMNDIDLADYKDADGSKGFMPIGTQIYPFYGTFNANDFTISNLNIKREYNLGLFGYVAGKDTYVESLGMLDASVDGLQNVGIIAGVLSNGAKISHSYAIGSVYGEDNAGLIAGKITNISQGSENVEKATISSCFAKGSVVGNKNIGGISGLVEYGAVVENCYSNGVVEGDYEQGSNVGGICGALTNGGLITKTYSLANVFGYSNVGGIIGFCDTNSIANKNIVMSGVVFGKIDCHRIVGLRQQGGAIKLNYATNKLLNKDLLNFNGNDLQNDINGATITTKTATTKSVWRNFTTLGFDENTWKIDDNFLPILLKKNSQTQMNNQNAEVEPHFLVSSTCFNGEGTAENPYKINNEKEFIILKTILQNEEENFSSFKSSYYTLENNLNLLNYKFLNKKQGVGNFSTYSAFKGTFNGNFKIINNLILKGSSNNLGLFSSLDGAKISNLGIVNVDVSGEAIVGALSARATNSTIENCFVSGKIKSLGEKIGGFVGEGRNLTITNSYFKGNVVGLKNVGGIVGDIKESSSITNCYAYGNLEAVEYVGGIVGNLLDQTNKISNNVSVFKSIKATTNIGRILPSGSVGDFSNNKGFKYIFKELNDTKWENNAQNLADGQDVFLEDFNNNRVFTNLDTTKWTVESGKMPILKGFDIDEKYQTSKLPENLFLTNSIFLGEGTKALPYKINSVDDFIKLQEVVNSGNELYRQAFYELTNDLNFEYYNESNATDKMVPIGNKLDNAFTGGFDGKGHKILNYYQAGNNLYAGIFGVVKGDGAGRGVVKNLTVNSCNIRGLQYVSGICAFSEKATIENCYVSGKISGTSYVGAIVAKNSSSLISNCYQDAQIAGESFVGGICGFLENGKIVNCFSSGNIVGTNSNSLNFGGILGKGNFANNGLYDATIENCIFTGNLKASQNVGGIVGDNSDIFVKVKNCVVLSEKIEANKDFGRISAFNSDNLSNNFAYILTKNDFNMLGVDFENTEDNKKQGKDISNIEFNDIIFWKKVLDEQNWLFTNGALPFLLNKENNNIKIGGDFQNNGFSSAITTPISQTEKYDIAFYKNSIKVEEVTKKEVDQQIDFSVKGESIKFFYYSKLEKYSTNRNDGITIVNEVSNKGNGKITIPANFVGEISFVWKGVFSNNLYTKTAKINVVDKKTEGQNEDEEIEINEEKTTDATVKISPSSNISEGVKLSFNFNNNPIPEEMSKLQFAISNQDDLKNAYWINVSSDILDNLRAKEGEMVYLRHSDNKKYISKGVLIDRIKKAPQTLQKEPDATINIEKGDEYKSTFCQILFNNRAEDLTQYEYTLIFGKNYKKAVWQTLTSERILLKDTKEGISFYLRKKGNANVSPSTPIEKVIVKDKINNLVNLTAIRTTVATGSGENTVFVTIVPEKNRTFNDYEVASANSFMDAKMADYYTLKKDGIDNIKTSINEGIYIRYKKTYLLPSSEPYLIKTVTKDLIRQKAEINLNTLTFNVTPVKVGQVNIVAKNFPSDLEFKIASSPIEKGIDAGYLSVDNGKEFNKTFKPKLGDSVWVRKKGIKKGSTYLEKPSASVKLSQIAMITPSLDKKMVTFLRGNGAGEINVKLNLTGDLTLNDFEFLNVNKNYDFSELLYQPCQQFRNNLFDDEVFYIKNVDSSMKLIIRCKGEKDEKGDYTKYPSQFLSVPIPLNLIGKDKTENVNMKFRLPQTKTGFLDSKAEVVFDKNFNSSLYEYKIGYSALEQGIDRNWRAFSLKIDAEGKPSMIIPYNKGNEIFVRKKKSKTQNPTNATKGEVVLAIPKPLTKAELYLHPNSDLVKIKAVFSETNLDDFEFFVGDATLKEKDIEKWLSCKDFANYSYGVDSFSARALKGQKIFIRYKAKEVDGFNIPASKATILNR